jgi:signal transduction histidine kinase
VSPAAKTRTPGIRLLRLNVLVALMLLFSALTALGIYVAQTRLAGNAQAEMQRDFDLELDLLHRNQDLRNATLVGHSRSVAHHGRIHAALEDDARDLLYPSAREELRGLTEDDANKELEARFYRFLDNQGAVIPAPPEDRGDLLPDEEAKLRLSRVPQTKQTGYLLRRDAAGHMTVDELIAVPIRSTETNEAIAALVLGLKPVETIAHGVEMGMKSGILVEGILLLPSVDQKATRRIAQEVKKAIVQAAGKDHSSLRTKIGGVPHQLYFEPLNPESNYPPAYEVCVYPLTKLLARQRQLRSQFLTAGGLLLLGGFVVSHFFSRRLSQPVEKLAVVSEENFAQRRRAEAELKTTAKELQRSARFSADASHQLKSPITVLRAGLDSLLARDGFPKDVYEEISTLIHQTYRLTGVVEDLLLLSRMDAGKLRLNLHTVDLTHLVAEWIDDLQAMPDAAHLRVEADIPDELRIAGETRFTSLVVQNLLDNARKYNRRGGIIRISAHEANKQVELRVANTGRGIPSEAQPYVFERFHRAGAGEDVPGHGLGLNLARELVRLHGGELRLVRSDAEWTEFRALFLAAVPAARIVGSAG